MDVSDALEHFGTDKFEDTCAAIMLEKADELPLGECCMGGWPDPGSEDVTVKVKNADDDSIYLDVTVYFSGILTTGCPDINRSESCQADLDIVIDRETGDGDISIRQWTGDDD